MQGDYVFDRTHRWFESNNGAKIKNPVERRDFCFVLFNIYHSLNAHDSNEMHLSDIFEKFVLNKAQLNILMIRMCCLLGYVCL